MRPADSVLALHGIGPKLAATLARHGVDTITDLLLHIPHRYEDRSRTVALDGHLARGDWVLCRGVLRGIATRGRRRRAVVAAVLDDGRGRLPVVWFNQPWAADRLRKVGEVSCYGQLRAGRDGRLQLVNPEVEELGDEPVDERVVPVYPAIEALGSRRLRRFIAQCLAVLDEIVDPLPDELRDRLQLPGLAPALRQLHAPDLPASAKGLQQLLEELAERRTLGHRRLAFDELLAVTCDVAGHRQRRLRLHSPKCRCDGTGVEAVIRGLPFRLTGAQRRVIGEIVSDLEGEPPMARLIQGDVGSGKTVVAAIAMLHVVSSGRQAALMAPTELLAEQHARSLAALYRPVDQAVELLTSSQPAADQRRIRKGLRDGSIQVVVGTHALFQEATAFHRIGIAVIDEQHRFGVEHRQALVDKGECPNLLVMTATPIPRSLALTIYGDLELSVIDELPPGRRPVRTVVRDRSARPKLFAFLAEEIARGGRAYIVYPAIEGGGDDRPALERLRAEVEGALPGGLVGVVHGRMSRLEREAAIGGFVSGELRVLLATTVVEVGVDVPEASLMVVEGADRFGLSQLHQLRGRVGRGERPSLCVLLVDHEVSDEARRRLEVLCQTTDGFEIAEADLALRGPGEMAGTRQWGTTRFRFADLVRDRELLDRARTAADELSSSGRLAAVRRELACYHAPSEVIRTG